MENEVWDYTINGREKGIIFPSVFAVGIIGFLAFSLGQIHFDLNSLLLFTLPFSIILLAVLMEIIKNLFHYFFFRVHVGRNGFYFQSAPFNGKYYEYKSIKSCHEETKAVIRRGRVHGAMFFYRFKFSFTQKDGKTVSFECAEYYEKEIKTLKKRIAAAKKFN